MSPVPALAQSPILDVTAPRPGGRAAALISFVLLIVALAAAISIDVVTTGFGVKSDEATYVGMTLSLVYDHDLAYQQRDLERFWGLYKTGPEGVILKGPKTLRLRVNGSLPFLHVTKREDPRTDRFYFGKALIYAVAAAPFVRLFGMNGFLVFHVLLLYAVCACGFVFLRARSHPAAALTFTLAFVGASVVPVYLVFLMPDFFNFALVFVAYFLWLYKEVAPSRSRWLSGPSTDVVAAVLLGIATYSKPTNAPLIAPLVLLAWWRRTPARGVLLGVVFLAVTGGLFGANAAVTGEFNFQGGDRKTFYGHFPFEAQGRDVWHENDQLFTTNDSDAASVLAPSEFAGRLAHNVEYFVLGRHFGFVPYFFPGAVALIAWIFSRDRFQAWRVFTVGSLAAATLLQLMFFPYSWSGGGGPPGNRYFLSLYPLTFFVMPAMQSSGVAILAWIGGALFTAKILVNPFVAAKRTWEIAEHGAARRLPVELTMANDLPARLADPPRGHIRYLGPGGAMEPDRDHPLMYLYFLDGHAYPPEPDGMWVAGGGRADVIVRTEGPVDHFAMTASSPIKTVLTISAGAGTSTIPIQPGTIVAFQVPASVVRGLESYACLLSAQSSDGFIPHLREPSSTDLRNLGVQVTFKPE